MSYVSGNLMQTSQWSVEGSIKQWVYLTTDAITSVLASGYFTDGGKQGMRVGDIVWVVNQTSGSTSAIKCQCSAAPSTTQGALTTYSSSTVVQAEVSGVNMGVFPRNMLDGGDATTNPWQRGTSITNIGATNTYTADRFFMVGGAGSSANMTKTANTTVPGFSQAFVWGRGQSSGSVSTLFVGQALESLDSIRAQGQPVTFSFWAAANTGFASGVSASTIGVQVSQGFGTDQSASALVNGTWTTQANIVSATQALTTTLTRYSFTGVVSATATQIGVLLSYTPTSTTAITAENVIMEGVQLEIGGLTPFEHRDIEVELALCQRYYYQVNEPASAVIVAAGGVGPTNSGNFILSLPTQMRAAPTVTVTQGSFGALVVGSYVALTSFAAGSTHTVNYINVNGLATMVSGQAIFLIGGSSTGGGTIKASADL